MFRSGSRKKKAPTIGPAARWAVELLERRLLLSNVTWTGSAGDNLWTTPSNWSNGAVPGTADDVTVNAANNPSIQITAGAQSVNSVNSDDAISIGGGTLRASKTTS
jgi:hypothetical protein